MNEMKGAVGAGTGRPGDDLCVENSVREFKIWADVLNYGKKILKNAGIVEADLDAWYLFEQIFGISRAQYFLCATLSEARHRRSLCRSSTEIF